MKTDFQHRICFVRFANSESGTFFLVKMIFGMKRNKLGLRYAKLRTDFSSNQ